MVTSGEYMEECRKPACRKNRSDWQRDGSLSSEKLCGTHMPPT